MTRTTNDVNDGLVWVVRTKDMQVRAHVEGCQAIKDKPGVMVPLRTPEDKAGEIAGNDPSLPDNGGPRFVVVVCKCVPSGRLIA